MFNMLLDIVSDDGNPDYIASGINHEELTGFLLIVILILFATLIFVTIKYFIMKEKYEELKNSSKNLNENLEEGDK